jgi:hypothetical protein
MLPIVAGMSVDILAIADSLRALYKNLSISGCKLEGIQLQHVYRNGKLIDDYLSGLVKPDLSHAASSQPLTIS